MDVRCPQCETLYDIQERQLRGGGATLKCSQCDHVFRLQTSVALNQENRRRWMLRSTSSGDILYFSAFDQLHKWIMNGEASKEDEISRTGNRWTRLVDVGEFMPIFKAVDSISSLNNAPAVQRADGPPQGSGSSPSSPNAIAPTPETTAGESADRDSAPHPRPQTGERSRVRTSQQFPLESAAPGQSPDSQNPPPSGQQSAPRTEQSGPQRSPEAPSRQPPQSNAPQPGSAPSPRPERTPSSSGMRTPASDRAQRQEDSGPVYDSGPLGGADGSDDWSFGDGSGLQEDPRQVSGTFDATEYESSSRWPLVLLIAVLVIGGGGAAVYFTNPGLVEGLIPSGEEKTVPIEEKTETEDPEPVPEGESAPEVVATATDAARAALTEREAELVGEAVEPAREAITGSVAEAKKEADEEAEEPDPDEMLRRAKRLLERGDANRARKKYHEILEIQRTNVEAITGLGWTLLASGSPAAAAAQFKRAKSINPSFGDAYIGLGKAERQLGNKQAALDAYATYLSRFPTGSKSSIAEYQKKKLEEELGQ